MDVVGALLTRTLLNFFRDKTRLIFSLLMPFFFLFVFSFVMQSAMSGITQPMNYLIAGIIIMTVFQTSLNNSIDILDDISSGFMKEIMVSPISRWQISIGQVLSSTVIAMIQGLIVVIVGMAMGLRIDAAHFLEMLGAMAVTGLTFSSLGLFLATLAKKSASFQVIITAVAMPLTFLSGAYIPTTVLPGFLTPIVFLNPLTYITSMFRYIAMGMENMSSAQLVEAGVAFDWGGTIVTPLIGLFITIAIGAVFFALCVMKFNKADFSTVKVYRHGH
jgi:ABC-2 type transport system permease protein